MSDPDDTADSHRDASAILAELERSLSSRVDSWAELDRRTAELLGVRPRDLRAFREVVQALDRFVWPRPRP